MSYGICVMQWMIAKTDKRSTLIPKAEVVLTVVRSETKYYLMQKSFTDIVSTVFKTKLSPR